ncbi:unnamed protein product [Closterium sp. NIES-64]|nr:unnamed protein product [Closterium sp. NIES-64]
MDRFTPQHSSELARRCVFSDLLGEGQSGRVWRCVDRATGEAFACKQVNKRGLSPAAEADLQREITLLIILQGHPNMLRLDSLYEDAKAVYILTELCDGGDLFGLLADHPRGLDERTVARIFAQVARAVQCGEAEYDVRLGDFGLAYQLPRDKCIVGLAGSAPYEAPEVLARAPYGCEADVWSLGVLLYALLSASWPAFRAGERKLVPVEDFGYFPWRKDARADGGKREVSWAAKDLICRMMTVDPQERIDIDGILDHPWLVRHLKCSEATALVTLTREDTLAATASQRRPEMATEAASDEKCYDSEAYKEANGEPDGVRTGSKEREHGMYKRMNTCTSWGEKTSEVMSVWQLPRRERMRAEGGERRGDVRGHVCLAAAQTRTNACGRWGEEGRCQRSCLSGSCPDEKECVRKVGRGGEMSEVMSVWQLPRRERMRAEGGERRGDVRGHVCLAAAQTRKNACGRWGEEGRCQRSCLSGSCPDEKECVRKVGRGGEMSEVMSVWQLPLQHVVRIGESLTGLGEVEVAVVSCMAEVMSVWQLPLQHVVRISEEKELYTSREGRER